MVSAYETDSKTPSVEVLIRLAHFYGTTVDYLINIDADKSLDISGLDEESVSLLMSLIDKLKKSQEN